jgi:hypothetical protein
MAGRGNPSFLKNQKAQKRVARATAKRLERQSRKAERAAARADALAPGERPESAEGEPSPGDAQSEPNEAEPPA